MKLLESGQDLRTGERVSDLVGELVAFDMQALKIPKRPRLQQKRDAFAIEVVLSERENAQLWKGRLTAKTQRTLLTHACVGEKEFFKVFEVVGFAKKLHALCKQRIAIEVEAGKLREVGGLQQTR